MSGEDSGVSDEWSKATSEGLVLSWPDREPLMRATAPYSAVDGFHGAYAVDPDADGFFRKGPSRPLTPTAATSPSRTPMGNHASQRKSTRKGWPTPS